MGVKLKTGRKIFSVNPDKIVVTDPDDIAVLRAIYDQAEPGWLDWDFSRPRKAILKDINATPGILGCRPTPRAG
jgi:hypothetical protein